MTMFKWFAQFQSQQRAILSAFAGFVFYGGTFIAIKAACTQGSYSFILTFLMTMLIEVIYRSVFKLFNNDFLITWLTILLTCAFIFTASWFVNLLAGTPEIFKTVVLGYFVGGTYSIVYVYSLAQLSKRDS